MHCHHCHYQIKEDRKQINISKFGCDTLLFHASCYENIAGKDYSPQVSPINFEIPKSLLLTQDDLNKYVRNDLVGTVGTVIKQSHKMTDQQRMSAARNKIILEISDIVPLDTDVDATIIRDEVYRIYVECLHRYRNIKIMCKTFITHKLWSSIIKS